MVTQFEPVEVPVRINKEAALAELRNLDKEQAKVRRERRKSKEEERQAQRRPAGRRGGGKFRRGVNVITLGVLGAPFIIAALRGLLPGIAELIFHEFRESGLTFVGTKLERALVDFNAKTIEPVMDRAFQLITALQNDLSLLRNTIQTLGETTEFVRAAALLDPDSIADPRGDIRDMFLKLLKYRNYQAALRRFGKLEAITAQGKFLMDHIRHH